MAFWSLSNGASLLCVTGDDGLPKSPVMAGSAAPLTPGVINWGSLHADEHAGFILDAGDDDAGDDDGGAPTRVLSGMTSNEIRNACKC